MTGTVDVNLIQQPGRPDGPEPQILLRCRAIIGSLPIPRPFDVDAFRAALETQRSRRLVLTTATLPPGCTGLWAASRSADYIFYGHDAAPAEQLRAIGHELGHMILGHRGMQISASEFARLLFLHLDPHKVAAALALVPVIARYSETEEAEADVFASLLLDRIGHTA
jgi:IrrE N-terminal-like domain